ncbi:MAG: hypothetical protein ACJAV7_002859 [Flavobacteriales bacterium]
MTSILSQCNIVSGESGTIHNSNSTISIGYITEISGGSQFYLNSAFTACDIVYPALNNAFTGNSAEIGIIAYTFDQPILSVRVVLAGVGLNGQTLPESFTFTTNNEDPVVSIDSGSCAEWTIDGDMVTSPDVVDGLNGIALIYSKTGFTTLTLTSSEGNNINGGSFIGFCDTSMIPAPIVSIEDFSFDGNITLYPNPTNGQSIINMGSVYENVQVRVSDLTGKTLQTTRVSGQQLIELNCDYPTGFYIVQLRKGELSAAIKLVVK